MRLMDFRDADGNVQEFDLHELGYVGDPPKEFIFEGKRWERHWGSTAPIHIPMGFGDTRHKFGMNRVGPTGKKLHWLGSNRTESPHLKK